MKKYLIFIVILVLLFILSCSVEKQNQRESQIVTTIYPIKLIVNQIDPSISCHSLIEGAVSPHHFSPKPSDIIKINKSDIIIRIGGNFDLWVDNIISKNNIDIEIINLIEKLDFKKDTNPHIWLSFRNTKLIADTLSKSFNKKYPSGASKSQKNLNSFKNEISKIQNNWIKKFNELNNKKVMLYHPAWEILLKELNLNVTGIIKENPKKSLTLKEMEKTINNIKESGTKLIIGEVQHKDQILKTIQEETNIKIVYLNAIGSNEFITYSNFLKFNLNKIYYELKK